MFVPLTSTILVTNAMSTNRNLASIIAIYECMAYEQPMWFRRTLSDKDLDCSQQTENNIDCSL